MYTILRQLYTLKAVVFVIRCLVGLLLVTGGSEMSAAEFRFGRNEAGVGGLTTAAVIADGVTLSIAAGPAGAVLDARGFGGLGVTSRDLAGVSGGEVDKFDVIAGSSAFTGQGEFVELVFDVAGSVTAIDFDGVKDESFEYFVVTTESGRRINFFDSAANTTVPGAVDAAIGDGALVGDVLYLLEAATFDDEIFGLAIPVAAGETMTITYAELSSAYGPIATPNGAKIQGFVFQPLPAPSAVILATYAAALAARRRRPRFH